MKVWFLSRWDELRTNFWFLPSVMVAGGVVLSLVTIHLDRATVNVNWIAALGWAFTRGPEGSRAVLSTVAGSMMTITSVAFSITVVALQLASSQFGPRLLRNFMRDRINQIALGTFLATFTYCLLVLRTVNGTEDEPFVPHTAVTIGLLMALASLGVLIFFFHNAAASIQADNVIAAVSSELHQAIHRLYPDQLGEGAPAEGVRGDLPADFDRESRPVYSERDGYIQAIDVDGLLEQAVERDLILQINQRPGKFVINGGEVARVWPGDRLDDDLADAIRGAFYLGAQRNLTQDIEFAIDQIVEVAVRALSPGINDPFTAIVCVDRLGAALCELADREIPSPFRYQDDRLRIVTDSSTAAGIVDAAFNQVRQFARGNVAVTIRQLEAIAAIAGRTRDPVFLASLARHADLIHRGSQDAIPEPWDRQEVDQRYREVLCLLTSDRPAEPIGQVTDGLAP